MSDYNEVKDNLTGILMSAIDGACPADVDDISDALTLIEQQQARIAELEDKRNRELNRKESELQGAFSMIDELAATVEQLRDALKHLHHNAKASGCEMGLALDVAEEALESTPQQNLNTVKREVAIEAFLKGAEWWAQCELDDTLYLNEHQASIDYANTKYPSDKDGEL